MQAEQYEKMVQDQRTFFLQSERIAVSGGPSMLARHPCGEIALVPRPLSMANEQPEVWDVGTAVANPYVVDSWPFEPNVLARRTMQEAPTMQPFKEETEEDLREASGPARRSPFGAFDFRLAMPTRDSEDEDDGFNSRYGGPTETSRSM
ncbi:unnamed protein product [Prorocentrum cordatum]|uniref:Uncharacterized protein n=1 Tax=Prorocentrum cordatum TaxID=2364126 RepID=A0ABN9X5F6_9DINO|nr:unnamed protein product [Polarella glacialis]